MQSKDNVLAALFKEYGDSSLLERLELYALWTISSVFPSAENRRDKGNAVIEHDYQSIGALMVNRLSWIQVGEDSENGWRKVFTFGTESGTPVADESDHVAIDRLANRVEVARFSPPKSKPQQR